MNDWSNILRTLIRSERATQRQLEAVSGVSRSTLKRVLRGGSCIRIDQLEDVLASLGYSIVIQKTGEADPDVRRKTTSRRPNREPILPKLIKAAGMGVHY